MCQIAPACAIVFLAAISRPAFLPIQLNTDYKSHQHHDCQPTSATLPGECPFFVNDFLSAPVPQSSDWHPAARMYR